MHRLPGDPSDDEQKRERECEAPETGRNRPDAGKSN
jgi:hypothetical protein